MIDSYGRSIYQKVCVIPLLPFLSKLTPVTLTFCALITGVSVMPLLAMKYLGFAFAMLLLSGFFDTVDGSVARFKNRTTDLGAALDITGDRIVEFSVILGLFLFHPEERALGCLLMLGSILICITTFLVVGIFTQNRSEKGFHYSPGLMERGEAFIFFSLMILFPEPFIYLAYLFSALVFGTAIRRLWQFTSHLQYTSEAQESLRD